MTTSLDQPDLFDDPEPGQVITALSPSKRDPSRIVVKVGPAYPAASKGKAACTIDQRHLLDLAIAKGDEWSPQLARRVRAAAEYDKARRYALNLATSRGIARADLIARIIKRGHAEETAQQIADELERIGIVNEQAYAESVARTIIRDKPAGARLIEHKLRQRKVDPKAIAQVKAQLADSHDELASATQLATKRAAQLMPRVDAQTARRRIFAQLARRGFPPNICAEATNRAVRECPSKIDD